MGAFRIFSKLIDLLDIGTANLPALNTPLANALGAITRPAASGSPNGNGTLFNFLDTEFTGSNNDLRFTQADSNPEPPTIQISKASSLDPTSISVYGRAISIAVAQNFGAVFITAAQLKTAIEATPEALALISVSYPPGNDGSGSIAPNGESIDFGPTPLSAAMLSGAFIGQKCLVGSINPLEYTWSGTQWYISGPSGVIEDNENPGQYARVLVDGTALSHEPYSPSDNP